MIQARFGFILTIALIAFAADRVRPEESSRSGSPADAPKLPPAPALKNPQAEGKFQEGIKKFQAEDYPGASSLFTSCLKEAATPADKKILQGLIEDTKLGIEIHTARKLVEQKNEVKGISRVEAALKKNPASSLAPSAQKFIRETEELIYCVIDDFEPGDGLPAEADDGDAEEGPGPWGPPSSRWTSGMSSNADPRFVLHGKGSMKWRAGGKPRGGRRGPRPEPRGYRSLSLKNIFAKTKWRSLAFSVYLPEAEEGNLRVTLAPSANAELAECLSTQKLIDLRGKSGWLPVRLDLLRDFGGVEGVKLEDMRFVRIDSLQARSRTIYLDFVHLE